MRMRRTIPVPERYQNILILSVYV
uniref:Uncharacterized protein n=1 Tax=Anguilla anguilla TaxID=7936 RepID=A0A0E9PG05_ANGAN